MLDKNLIKKQHQKFEFINSFLILVAVSVVAYSVGFSFLYANQAPLDLFSFRQTQTALTSYWFMRDGFKLAYDTPVAGPPWSIPFEFPIYQFLVAEISKSFNVSLDIVGRIVSYLFLLLCLIPAKSITKTLKLPVAVFYIFAAILFSAPIYLYYGRAFMMETAALYFAIASIQYFVEILMGGANFRSVSLYMLLITVSILQKATTGLPVLALLSFIFMAVELKKSESIKDLLSGERILTAFIYFAIPLVIGVAWVFYTDYIKSFNSLGQSLTSSALTGWNWGTLRQRFSPALYVNVLWSRIFVANLAGIFGVSLLLFALFVKSNKFPKIVILLSVIFGVAPLFLFTNLHIIHSYYQSANIIFFIYAVAVALGGVIMPIFGRKLIIPSLLIILASNYVVFAHDYLPAAREVFAENNRDFVVGEILRRELSRNDEFVAFGNDWSSTFAYMSQRKSFTVPGWFENYQAVALHPENFVDKGRLGAVVACSVKSPGIANLISWSSDNRSWKIGETQGCYIAIPEKSKNLSNPRQAQCQGGIDVAGVQERDGGKIISFAGWVATQGKDSVIPVQSFIVLTGPSGKINYLETLKVPRLDVNSFLKISNKIDAGFSRIISADLPAGEYDVGIAKSEGDHLEICNIHKQMAVSGKTDGGKQ